MVRRRMRCDAPIFTDADYDFIMQRRDERPRYQVLKDLSEKYGTSTKRIYQIWRGEEDDRIIWDQPLDSDCAEQSPPKPASGTDNFTRVGSELEKVLSGIEQRTVTANSGMQNAINS
ncbi:unnamed protein product [Rhizophagus irregularis]|nr:unnamed protein product [Rhizophagus irregularis]